MKFNGSKKQNEWTERVEQLEAEKKELVEAYQMALRVLLQYNDFDSCITGAITDLQAAIAKTGGEQDEYENPYILHGAELARTEAAIKRGDKY